MRVRKRTLVQKFFADRGTHLAAMVAYFALLSFVPLTFLALSLLGLSGRADESTFLVRQIRHALPGVPIGRIVNLVNSVRRNAATLDGSVFVVRDHGRVLAATTPPEPTVGLVFYDLKSCLRSIAGGGEGAGGAGT